MRIKKEIVKLNQTQKNLIEDNIKFIYWNAQQWNKTQSNIELDDLISLCFEGSVKAAGTYDETKDIKFTTYSKFLMDNTIKEELKNIKKHSVAQNEYDDSCIIEEDKELIMDIKDSINLLPDSYKNILLDLYTIGYTQKEIANKYNISQSKVSVVIRKSKKIILNYLNVYIIGGTL